MPTTATTTPRITRRVVRVVRSVHCFLNLEVLIITRFFDLQEGGMYGESEVGGHLLSNGKIAQLFLSPLLKTQADSK